MAGFRRQLAVDVKGRGNFLTETDLAVERLVIQILRQEYPDIAILSEETAGGWTQAQREAALSSSGWLWVVDPLDGTHNYSQGVPHFCFNLALCYGGQPRLALTYDPLRKQEFFALENGGATLDGMPVRVAQTVDVPSAIIGIDLGYDDARAANLLRLVLDIWPRVQAIRVMGSGALGLAYAASGLFDLFVHHYLFPWDIAPGILLVRESGGLVLDRDGGPVTLSSEGIVAGAPKVVEDFLRLAEGRAWR